MYKPEYPGLYYFDTFTFTTLGASGNRGPESTKGYANAPWRDGEFSIVDGQQQWTVPATGTYNIVAAGAYGATPGRVVSGDIDLYEGQILSLLVGQQPTPLTANVVDATTVGGGGGTFIGSSGTLLMVASGGDGTGGSAASFSPYGDGNGKNGGGYLSNGLATNATFKFLKPEAYVDGGFGNSFPTGVVPEEGGFGGGQSPVTSGISGGGGYTGSAGDGVSGATCYADESVMNFTDLGAASNTNGYVTVSLMDPAPITFDAKAINPVIKKFYSNRNLRSIIWSPEFGKYFAVSSPGYLAVSVVVYSKDLEAWTGTESPQGCQSVCWSPKLKLFTTGNAVSADGLSWTSGDSTKNFYQIVWCDFMNSFFAWIPNTIDNQFNYTYPYKSSDGLTWTEMTDGPLVQSIVDYGPLSSVSVGAQSLVFIRTYSLTTGDVYTYDGTTWTSHQSNAARSAYYDNQFVLFLIDSTCYTSLDGVSWYYKSYFPFDPESGISACTVFENTLYVCISGSGLYTRFYSSQNLLTWTQIDTIGSEITKLGTTIKAVVNVNSILLASTNIGKTLVSVDFRIWAPLTTSLFPGSEILWATLCFSPETGYLVASGNTNPEGKTVVYYSNDAVIWNSVTLDTVIHDINIAAWMPSIGKFIFNGYYLVDPLNNWEVSTISSRPNPGYGNQWYPIGKVLICQNGDQTNDAYNWRNDPNVTVDVGYGTSGGWLYPNTMIALGSSESGINLKHIRTSLDTGKTWITTNYQAAGATFGTSGALCIVHSPPPYVQYSIMTSTDGITWTPGINPGNFFFCYGIFWISSIKMFAAVFSPGYDGNFSVVSLTSDGNNWSTIYSLENNLLAVTWCENINTLVIIGYSGDYTLNITF